MSSSGDQSGKESGNKLVSTVALDRADFSALGRGDGDVETLRTLRDGQLSKRLALLTLLLERASLDADRWNDSGMDTVLDVFQKAEDENAEIVRKALLYPYVGEWLAQCRIAIHAAPEELFEHLRYLGNVTAVCALDAGLECELPVSMIDGDVALPGMGVASSGSEPDDGTATVKIIGDRDRGLCAQIAAGGRVVAVPLSAGIEQFKPSLPTANGEPARWLALRRIDASCDGLDISLIIDDLDPFRGGHGLRLADRLDDTTVAGWQGLLRDGWEILVRRHRERAELLAEGLVCIAPVEVDEKGTGANATSMNAFGALSMSWPYDPSNLAVGLVHEFQHGKLGALLDLVPLCVPDDSKRFYAPWRGDPRPLGGLLQGAYAYVGVTDFWNVERQVEHKTRSYAHVEFARWREQVRRAVDVIAASGQLTDEGVDFVAELRSRCDAWRAEQVPEGLADAAIDLAVDHEMMWRLRNLAVDEHVVESLSDAWQQGAPPSTVASEDSTMMLTTGRILEVTARHDLLARKLTSRTAFEAQCAGLTDSGEPSARFAADLAYVGADYEVALQLYVDRIEGDPTDMDAWAGLALSAKRSDRSAAAVLWSCPELAAALYRSLRAREETVSPLDVAGWLTAERH